MIKATKHGVYLNSELIGQAEEVEVPAYSKQSFEMKIIPNPFYHEQQKIIRKFKINEMDRQEKIKRLQDLQHSLQLCTRPVKNHPDPNSNTDCWNWMRELLAEIKEEDEKLLLRAKQFQREQIEISDRENTDHHRSLLTGIDRIVSLIKRHFGKDEKQPA